MSARSEIDPTRGPWMTTYTGRRFYPFSPQPEDVCIEDEAHALAAAPRFGGHAKTFSYCVAHHSTLVSLLCEAMSASSTPGMTQLGPLAGLQGHHHDGGEYVLLDQYECEDWRLQQIADGIKTLRKRISMGTAGAKYADEALRVIGEPGGLLRHGLYGEPAQALFLARHHDLIARRDAAVAADEVFAAATDVGRPR